MDSLVDASARAIAEALSPSAIAPSAKWRWGTVVSVSSDGTMDVSVGGSTVTGIRCAQHVMGAAIGDRVRISYQGADAVVDAVRATSKLVSLPTISASSLTLGTPLPVASGGTGADNATDACAGINAARASNQSTQNVLFTPLSSASQTIGISYNVTNSSDSYYGDRLLFIIRDQGFSLYDSTNSTTEWQVTFPSGATNFDVATSSPTLNSNATATNFDLRKQGSVVSLQVYQLKVAESLADAANVQIGSAIIPSAYRPKVNTYVPLVANVNGKGAGCFLYITTGGNVSIYNRSGSALGTGTNLAGNTTWVV